MLSTDLQNQIEHLRDLKAAGELTAEVFELHLVNLEEIAARLTELEFTRSVTAPAPARSNVRVCRPGEAPPPAGYREAAAQRIEGLGETASFEPDPNLPVVRLEDFRGRR